MRRRKWVPEAERHTVARIRSEACTLQGRLAEQDQFRQALLFYRSMPPLQIRIQIGTAWWQFNYLDPDRLQDTSERRAEFCISIVQQIPAAIEKADVRLVC